jgi:hypothetical protein
MRPNSRGDIARAAVAMAVLLAAVPGLQAADPTGEAVSLQFVPRDAALVFSIRPARLLANEMNQPLLDFLTSDDGLTRGYGIEQQKVDAVTAVVLLTGQPDGPRPFESPVFILRMTPDGDALAVAQRFSPNAAAGQFDGRDVFVALDGQTSYAMIDGRTVILAPTEGLLRRLLISGPVGQAPESFASVWQEVSGDDAAVAINSDLLPESFFDRASTMAAIEPLWKSTTAGALGLRMRDEIELHGLAEAATDEDVQRVQETLSASLVLLRNSLSALRSEASDLPAEHSARALRLVDMADDVIGAAKIDSDGRRVLLFTRADAKHTADLVQAMAPMIAEMQTKAKLVQDIKNLRQILLAMHNYHDVHNHFPPAVVRSPDGKPLYSWRVELLPYLDQGALYNEYHRDEAWDSPHNKKLIARMPAAYRSAVDPPDSIFSSYYGFTGPHTIFGDPEGASLRKITDGTSNTLAVVEAKREIPWTKPEDLPYDAGKPIPEIGGRYEGKFLGALCDGSTRVFERSKVTDEMLRLLITRDDGQPIPSF